MKRKTNTPYQSQKRNLPTLVLALFIAFFSPHFLMCQSSTSGERINLGLYGGASLDFAIDTNVRIFSVVETAGTIFYSDDTCASWTQAFPYDSMEYQSAQRGWSGGRRVLTNKTGWVGVQTAESGGTLRSSVISYDDGDSGTFVTAFDNYILRQIEPAATGQNPSAIDLTDHWFYVGMDNYLLRTSDTSTYGIHNIIVDLDTVSEADTNANILWISAANTASGFPLLLVTSSTSNAEYGKLLSFDGSNFTDIPHPTVTTGSGTVDYYYQRVFTHPVDTTQDTIIVSCIDPTSNNIKVFRSFNGGIAWTDITPPSGTNWPLQNADYYSQWESLMPSSNGLRLSFPGGDYSDDLGNTWAPHVMPDNAVAFYPFNPDYMVASKNKGPQLSKNGGSTFTHPLNEGHSAVSITKIAQLRRNTYYVATKAGLGYTTAYHDPSVTGVQQWRPPYGDFPISGVGNDNGVTAVDIDPDDSLHVVVGCNTGFYYTTTGPTGFIAVTPSDWDNGSGGFYDDMVTDVQFITSDTIVAVTGTGSNVYPCETCRYGNVWLSVDGGASWVKMHPVDGGNTFEQGNSVAVGYGSTDTTIYIGTGYWDHHFDKVPGALWKSTDFGSTWSFVNWGPQSQATGSTVDSLPIYDLDVYPGTVDTIYFATGQNLDYAFAKSTDGGATYDYINNMIPEGNFSSVMVHPDDPDIVSVAARRDLWRTNTVLNSTTLVFEGMPGEFIPDLEYGSVIMGTTTGLYKLSEEPGSVTTIWNGEGNWSDATKWSNGIPYNIVNAIIETGTVTVDVAGEANSVEVKPGAAMTIGSGNSVSLQDKLLLESDDTGDASFIDEGTLTVGGSVTVERYLSQDQWHYLTPPVSDATAQPFMGIYLKWWDEPNGDWEYVVNASDPLLAGKGYASWSDGGTTGNTTIEYTGTLNTGDYSPVITLSGDTSANYGWNLIGNAYPSAFDWDDPSITKTNIGNTIYFWDGSQYITYNGTSHVGTGGATSFVPSQQAFFVQAYDNNPGLTITQDSRVHKNVQFLNNSYRTDNLLKLHVEGNGYKDEMLVLFTGDATNSFDPAYDAHKLYGIDEAPQFYSYCGTNKLTMNVQPFDGPVEAIALGFEAGISGTFTLWAEGTGNFPEDMYITLEDTKTHEIIDLRTDSIYTFQAVNYEDPHRFVLYFDGTTLATEENTGNAEISVYTDNDRTINIKNISGKPLEGDMHIYDLLGRKYADYRLEGSPVRRFKTNLPAGTYIVSITTSQKTITKRVFIK